ncbi:MAG: enhanced serine sensitivity protein SseB [Saccharofermentans sp.]|nr:enhanced serine sensitivity protein SseB [Saccharofermentans sp.]
MEDIFFDGQIHNAKLKELMGRLRSEKTDSLMTEILRLACASEFVVPVNDNGGKISFTAIGDPNGKRYLAVFSDTDEFKANGSKDSKLVKAKFDDILSTVMAEELRLDGMVIDPGSSEVIFGHEMLKMIYDQMSGPMDVKVGEPDHYPENLKTAMISFMKEEPVVKAIYVKLFVRLSDEMTGWMFVIDADRKGDEMSYLCDTFNRYITPYTDGLTSITASYKEAYANDAVVGSAPFVKRDGDKIS